MSKDAFSLSSDHIDWSPADYPTWEDWPRVFGNWASEKGFKTLEEASGADRWQWRFLWQNVEFSCHAECLSEAVWIESSDHKAPESIPKLYDFLTSFR